MNEWINCEKQTPPEGIPVWLFQHDRVSPWVGAYEYCGDDPGGWFYGNTYGSEYWDGSNWKAFDNEWDDEYRPTHWMPLPDPPVIP
jgi:hypothetical protein